MVAYSQIVIRIGLPFRDLRGSANFETKGHIFFKQVSWVYCSYLLKGYVKSWNPEPVHEFCLPICDMKIPRKVLLHDCTFLSETK